MAPGAGGIARKAAGHGFNYGSANGRRIRSTALLARIDALMVPPAWKHVWIASDPRAHIQATGVDAAGRTQYLYHPHWRELRDDEKFIRSLAFAQSLPALRRRVMRDLKQQQDPRRRALAAAVRLMDRAGLRVGGAVYADENGSFSATTLQRRQVHAQGQELRLLFRGKSTSAWDLHLSDDLLGDCFASMPHTPRHGPALSHPVMSGRRKLWQPITDSEVNAYLGRIAGAGFTAKDFRTWQAQWWLGSHWHVPKAPEQPRQRPSPLPSEKPPNGCTTSLPLRGIPRSLRVSLPCLNREGCCAGPAVRQPGAGLADG